jgi:hypothetical protein
MRKASLALIIFISVHVQSLHAACKTDACKQATAWKNGYTAIVLDDNISRTDYFAVLDAVKANKGVVAIEAERVLLGWMPITKAAKIRAARGVSAVLYEAVPHPDVFVHRDEALAALSFFNRVRTGEFEDTVEKGLAVTGEPLIGCIKDRPTSARAQVRNVWSTLSDSQPTEENSVVRKAGRNLTIGDDLTVLPQLPSVVFPQWSGQTPFHNPDMRGRVTVQLFRLDSNGTVDPNTYSWTNADLGTSRDQVYSAFTFWVDQATARGITLSFRVQTEDPFSRYTRSLIPTPTQYEPITHYTTDDYLWVNDALAANGYGASPVNYTNVYNQNDAFNDAKAADPFYGPFDRSFSIYIVYNPFEQGAPSRFLGQTPAYTMTDGPFEMVMWNSEGWGPANLGLVITHETGHIFWACDEYAAGCGDCDFCHAGVGPRPWANNANCDDPNSSGSCLVPRTTCVMKDLSHTLCPFTPNQIGW